MTMIKKLLHWIRYPKAQIVYVQGEYCTRCQEFSRDTGTSNYYNYTKPSLFITNDNHTVSANDIFNATGIEHSAICGVKGEYYNTYPEQGVRNREYILHISEEACPLKVKYSLGSGESHKDSDFWSSDHKEYWVVYLRKRS